MEVQDVTSYTTAATEALETSGRIMGKDDFLKLLATQLQHQDPLDPQDNTEMVAQLAQFSSLEQLENMNESLASSLDLDLILTQVLNNTAAAGLIGKSILAVGDTVHLYDSGSATFNFKLGANAETVTITIYDEDGATVRTIEETGMEAGRQSIEWDGKDASGNQVSEGTYTYSVSAENAEGETVAVVQILSGVVDVVKFKDGEAFLSVNGVDISISDILEIYEDEPETT